MASVVCRLCCKEVVKYHSISLFSPTSVKSGLAGRLSKLAEVPILESDGLPKYLCRNCRDKFVTLESKLQEFRAKAQSSYSPRQAAPLSRKRVKDTGGQGVSPRTAEARPRSKRSLSSRVLFADKENVAVQQGK